MGGEQGRRLLAGTVDRTQGGGKGQGSGLRSPSGPGQGLGTLGAPPAPQGCRTEYTRRPVGAGLAEVRWQQQDACCEGEGEGEGEGPGSAGQAGRSASETPGRQAGL